MEQPNPTPESTELTKAAPSSTVKATRKQAAKPAKLQTTAPKKPVVKAAKIVQAPAERAPRPGDEPYTVTLQPRHAEWIERRARQLGRTASSMIEKVIREGYAADPDNKAGASTNNAQNIDQVAEQNRGG